MKKKEKKEKKERKLPKAKRPLRRPIYIAGEDGEIYRIELEDLKKNFKASPDDVNLEHVRHLFAVGVSSAGVTRGVAKKFQCKPPYSQAGAFIWVKGTSSAHFLNLASILDPDKGD